MKLILLSGGSGKRLWPLSNDSRSKQFLPLLEAPDGSRESMVQRVLRQIREAGLDAGVTLATNVSQKEIIEVQLGENVETVLEPQRRDTFPAIALASAWLSLGKKCPDDEVVVIMPCDPYTETGYFKTIASMAKAVEDGAADLVLMGITPTYPSAKYGYVVPGAAKGGYTMVRRFTEKPDVKTAESLLAEGAFWNGGVFAFRLGYMMDIARKYLSVPTFDEFISRYAELPKISFDYEVAEKAASVAVIPFSGQWKDLGTWNTFTEEISTLSVGNVCLGKNGSNTHVINELQIPIFCDGLDDAVVAASPEGILVSAKKTSENIKDYVSKLSDARRPMFEERRWGSYRVLDFIHKADGTESLVKKVTVWEGRSNGCHSHQLRSETWTVVEGEGLALIDGVVSHIGTGSTVTVPAGCKHAVKAVSNLVFVEVQTGNPVSMDDIERFDYNWN